jgi:hypothetical protein
MLNRSALALLGPSKPFCLRKDVGLLPHDWIVWALLTQKLQEIRSFVRAFKFAFFSGGETLTTANVLVLLNGLERLQYKLSSLERSLTEANVNLVAINASPRNTQNLDAEKRLRYLTLQLSPAIQSIFENLQIKNYQQIKLYILALEKILRQLFFCFLNHQTLNMATIANCKKRTFMNSG